MKQQQKPSILLSFITLSLLPYKIKMADDFFTNSPERKKSGEFSLFVMHLR
jgi:hypothetical protein